MKKAVVISCILACILGWGMMVGAGYCQDDAGAKELKIVKGNVYEIEWVAAKLVVRTFDFGGADEITFTAPEDTKITQGADEISLADMEQCDVVTIEYYSSLAGLIAVNITVAQ